jgi:hypothetical protein
MIHTLLGRTALMLQTREAETRVALEYVEDVEKNSHAVSKTKVETTLERETGTSRP